MYAKDGMRDIFSRAPKAVAGGFKLVGHHLLKANQGQSQSISESTTSRRD